MFNWYNKLGPQGAKGLAGFMRFLRVGTDAFVTEWYSAAEQKVTA
jgi:hypothetical protein